MQSSVCPSVYLSVWDEVYFGAHGRLNGWKLVQSCTVVFLDWQVLFTSLDIFAAGCIVQPQNTAKKPNRWNFLVRNSHRKHGHMTMVIPDATYSVVRFCRYTIHVRRTVCSTIGLLNDSWASCYYSHIATFAWNLCGTYDVFACADVSLRNCSVGYTMGDVLVGLRYRRCLTLYWTRISWKKPVNTWPSFSKPTGVRLTRLPLPSSSPLPSSLSRLRWRPFRSP